MKKNVKVNGINDASNDGLKCLYDQIEDERNYFKQKYTSNELFERCLKEAEEHRKKMSKWNKFCEWFQEWVIFYVWLKPLDVLETAYYDVKYGTRNLFTFFKVVWKYRTWDYYYPIRLFQEGLKRLRDELVHEEDESREKRRNAITELIKCFDDILDNDYGDDGLYKEFANGEIDYSEWEKRKNARRDMIYDKINHLLRGQSDAYFNYDGAENYEDRDRMYWEQFDGSGIEGWWD